MLQTIRKKHEAEVFLRKHR